MSNIDKLKSAAAKAVDNFDPNMFVETRDVLALLDELEAAEKRIAELSASHGNLREAMAGIHNTITDGGAYTPLAAILNSSKRAYTAQPAPVSVPAAMEMDDDFDSAFEHGKAVGWNACRDAMLKHSEPFIVTSDHRMMEMPQVEAINAVTAMLHGAEPVTTAYKLPEGWVAVPVEPTEEMIAAAMCSNDVLFDKEDDTLFRVQHGEIWRAMLSTAPQQEVTQALAKGMERYGDAMQELAKKEVK
ncbi:hypothetical protein N8V20_02015 [Enterobacter hormaechei subsp. steigerwaltii]|nr:hypothetical protein [Enterobacter hormaechei subsp. steigerwaltii]MCU3366943.1 hypothetical protein [Enterobacter hormaechei subsp. steigerwaltii]